MMPCGSCRHCKKLLLGIEPLNIQEIDATGHNDIGTIRPFMRQIDSPEASRQDDEYKIFIIDECHLLTKEAWHLLLCSSNALGTSSASNNLVFILITADVEQLPRTVVSRCHKFTFPKVKDADIVSKMKAISSLERIDIEEDALQLIVARADGSLCEAEITLDQLSTLGQKITIEVVSEMVKTSLEHLISCLTFKLCFNSLASLLLII